MPLEMKLNAKTHILLPTFASYLFYQQTIASERKLTLIDYNNKTPLHFLFSSTLSKDDMQEAQLRLSQGAHANITYYDNNPLLHSIIERSKDHDATCNFVQLLSEHKADINVKNNAKETPLTLAIKKGNEKLVKLLLESGAQPDVEDEYGDHTIHLAMEWDTEQENPFYKKRKILPNIVMLLLQHKADPNRTYRIKGARPLHAAVFHNAPTIVQALLSYGALKDVCDDRGFTPLSLAQQYNYTDIITILSDENKIVIPHQSVPPTKIDEEIESFHMIPTETTASNKNKLTLEKTIIVDEEIESFYMIPISEQTVIIDKEIESFHIITI